MTGDHVPTTTPQLERLAHQRRRYVVYHEFGDTTELSTTLVHAISDVTGIDVTDTEHTIYEYFDPEALDNLFRPKYDGTLRASGQYEFTIWGCRVTVHSSGEIEIQPLPTNSQLK